MSIIIKPASEIASREPGLYSGVEDDVYFGIDAASNSRLSALKRSPRHCLIGMGPVDADSEALRFGSIAHAAVLQPDVYKTDYRIFKGDLRSGAQKELYQQMKDEVGDRNVVREKDAEIISDMTVAINEHRIARAVMSLKGPSELVALWVDEDTDLLCKSKIDRYCTDKGVVIDYKTTKSADPADLSRSVASFGYHRQGAFYLRGLRTLGIDLRDFVLVAQEKTWPHMVGVYRIANTAILQGDIEVHSLLAQYAECKASGNWPGYTESEIIDIDIPQWYYNQNEVYEL